MLLIPVSSNTDIMEYNTTKWPLINREESDNIISSIQFQVIKWTNGEPQEHL